MVVISSTSEESDVRTVQGSKAALGPSVVDGKINNVQILNKGENYSDAPTLL